MENIDIEKLCANCGTALLAQSAFCIQCGQKANTHRLSWHDVQHDLTHYFTHADKGIFFLFKELATRTGRVAKEYISGKRKKYMSPVTFYLLCTAIYVLIHKLYGHYFPSGMDTLVPPGPGASPIEMRSYNVSVFSRHNLKMYSFLAVPFAAFVFWLFYRKKRINYVEQLAATMYCNGFTLIVMAVIFSGLGLLAFNNYNSPVALGASMIFQVVYYIIFFYHFIGDYTPKGKLFATLSSLAALAAWMIFVFSLFTIYITTGFFGLLD